MLRLLFFCLCLSWAVLCQAQTNVPRTLSLNDAILLALRENPTVQSKQLGAISEKYSLEIAQWKFKPHYTISATKQTSQTYSSTQAGEVTQNITGITPKATLDTPFGTSIELSAANNLSNGYHPGVSLLVTQPLIKGFGRPIVEAALLNAMENVKINRLEMEETLRNTITNVISNYLEVILAEKTLEVDQNAMKSAQKSIEQTKLMVKAGRKAGVELVSQEAAIADKQATIESDKNSLAHAHAQLLQTIGMDPNSNIVFTDINVPKLIRKYHIPALEEAKKLIVAHDVSYQRGQIIYEGSQKRSLAAAENNKLWSLNLTAAAATGGGSSAGQNAGLNSLVNGVNRNDRVTLDLTIPIDDQQTKLEFEKAKIALQQAAIGLKQQKWESEAKAIDNWNNVFSAERSLKLTERSEMLQQKSYNVTEQKYNYGLIDSIELQSVRQQYVASQQGFVKQQIQYLKALVSLDQSLGQTLQTWNIQVARND